MEEEEELERVFVDAEDFEESDASDIEVFTVHIFIDARCIKTIILFLILHSMICYSNENDSDLVRFFRDCDIEYFNFSFRLSLSLIVCLIVQ